MGNRGEGIVDSVNPDEVVQVFDICRTNNLSEPLFRRGEPFRPTARAEAIQKFGEAKADELLARLLEYYDGFMCMEDRISGRPRNADGMREGMPPGLSREIYEESVKNGDSISVGQEVSVRLKMFRIAFPECPREIRDYLRSHYCIRFR